MILQAAGDIVAEQALRGLSARKVAGRIGYTVGTIYNFFDNLDDLIVHVNAEMLDRLEDVLAKIEPDPDVVASLKSLARAYVAFIEAHPHRWNMLFDHRLPPGQTLPDWYQIKIAHLLARLDTVLKPLFADPNDPALARASRTLWASLHGIVSLAEANKLDVVKIEKPTELADSLIENFVAGLKARRRTHS